jgi:hypothetical protein
MIVLMMMTVITCITVFIKYLKLLYWSWAMWLWLSEMSRFSPILKDAVNKHNYCKAFITTFLLEYEVT